MCDNRAIGRFLKLFELNKFLPAHKRTKNLGDLNAAVGLLILFDKCGEYSRGRKSAAVKRMNEFGLAGLGIAVSRIVSSCLVVVRVGNRTYLFVDAHGGNPNFDIVSASHRSRAVARGEFAQSEMQTEFAHKRAGFSDEFFKRFFGMIGVSVLNHFHLIELVTADHAAFFGAIAARLFTIAGSVSKIFHRQFAFVDYFARVHIDERGFRCRQHKACFLFVAVLAVNPINLVGEFGELTCAEPAAIAEHVRGENKFVTVGKVFADEEIQKRPFKPCAVAAIQPISAAGEFNAAFVVDKTESGAKIDVVFGFEIELRFFAENFYYLIVFFFAGEQVVVRNVR